MSSELFWPDKKSGLCFLCKDTAQNVCASTIKLMRIKIWLWDKLFRHIKNESSLNNRIVFSLIDEAKPDGGTLPGVDLNCSSDLEDRMSGL